MPWLNGFTGSCWNEFINLKIILQMLYELWTSNAIKSPKIRKHKKLRTSSVVNCQEYQSYNFKSYQCSKTCLYCVFGMITHYGLTHINKLIKHV